MEDMERKEELEDTVDSAEYDVDDAQPEQGTEEPARSLGEKIEDTLDEVVANTQDFFYGERHSMSEDLIATMPDPDTEIRHVNKVQTRRNIMKRVLGKKGSIILLVLMGIGMLIGFVVSKIG